MSAPNATYGIHVPRSSFFLDAVLQRLVDNHLLEISGMTQELFVDSIIGTLLLGWQPGLNAEGRAADVLQKVPWLG